MSHLRQEDLRALEQTRQRLYQLSQSIGSLKADVLRTSPMPAWDSLQLSASILAQSLKSITDHMSTHSALFERAVVFPSTNFPGRTQENLLGQLLRKKLEPSVEAWVEEGRAVQVGNEGSREGEKDIEEVWKEARGFIGERVARAAVTHRTDAYTAEEREMGIENVNTGLMQPIKLGNADEESDEDEENGGDEGMADADSNGKKGKGRAAEEKYDGPVRTLDDIVRFMTIGKTPEDGSEPLKFEARR